MDTITLLKEEITNSLNKLNDLEGEERTQEVENLNKLYKLLIEEEKVDVDAEEKYQRRVMEDEHHTIEMSLRQQQIDADKEHNEAELNMQERQFKFAIGDAIANLSISLGTFLIGLNWQKRRFWEGLKFEETGSITSTMMKGISNKIFPKK